MILNSVKNAEIIKRPYGLIRILAAGNSKRIISKRADLLLLEIEPGKKTTRHYHLKSEEIFYIINGKAVISGDDTTLEVKEDDVVLIQTGEIHGIKNIGKKPCIILMVESPPYDEKDKFYVAKSSNIERV